VAPELVADLADLLRRVAGTASSDQAGTITINLVGGVDGSEIERQLRAVADRWSEMHPGVRVRVTSDEQRPHRHPKFRRTAASPEGADVVTAGSPAGPE
jgi:ABC-type glycerol-3-phosphate transport system substrate-binding protein